MATMMKTAMKMKAMSGQDRSGTRARSQKRTKSSTPAQVGPGYKSIRPR